MATPIGSNVINAISRRHILREVTDNIYGDALMFFRLSRANKKLIQGGTQIEAPLMYARMAAGGFYTGLDLLDVSPSDTVKNAAFDWRQAYVPVTFDGLSLIKIDSPEAIVNGIKMQFEQANLEMAEILDGGIWSDGVANVKSIDGLKGAVDDSTVLTTYGGLSRTTNTWWKSQIDTATAVMTLASLQSMFGKCRKGGRHPTIIVSTQANYDRYWNLVQVQQQFPSEPKAHDEQLAQAGFTNLLFSGVPWTVDEHVPANHIFFLNEDYIKFCVSPRGDFFMQDFQEPINQDAIVAKLMWAGNLLVQNVARQGKMTAVAA
jgi:hypothetical protein